MPRPAHWFLSLIVALLTPPALAGEVRVAVASNFAGVMEPLATAFSERTGHQLRLSYGSTGKHYAQIRQGAPFDVFLAADEARPERLEAEGVGVPGTRFTYATGVLVLWNPTGEIADPVQSLQQAHRIALANPRLAPYGRAAQEALQALGLWESVGTGAVRGENIAQTYQFVATGNAGLGFIALSQWQTRPKGDYWLVPETHYQPIAQQAILLRDTPPARAFLQFLRSDSAQTLIREGGYR